MVVGNKFVIWQIGLARAVMEKYISIYKGKSHNLGKTDEDLTWWPQWLGNLEHPIKNL